MEFSKKNLGGDKKIDFTRLFGEQIFNRVLPENLGERRINSGFLIYSFHIVVPMAWGYTENRFVSLDFECRTIKYRVFLRVPGWSMPRLKFIRTPAG